MAADQVTPELPPGFQLENQTQSAPPLPPGFQMEQGHSVEDPQIVKAIQRSSDPSVINKDGLLSMLSGIEKGIVGIPGVPQDINNLVSLLRQKIGLIDDKQFAHETRGMLPTSQEMIEGAKKLGLPFHEPETSSGKILDAIGQAAGSAAIGGPLKNIAYRMLVGGAGGAGGEIADKLTEGMPGAKLVGSVLTGTAVGIGPALRTNAGAMIKEATQDVTPQQWQSAIATQEQAKKLGIPLMGPESLPMGSVQQLAADVNASKTGGRTIGAFLDKRPEQITSAVNRQLDKVATAEAPSDTIVRAQKSATDIISKEEKARTKSSAPYYEAAAKDRVSDADVDQITSKAAALSKQLEHIPEVHKQILDFNEQVLLARGNVGKLDDVYKYWRNKIETSPINATSAEKFAAKKLGELVSSLDKTLRKNSGELTAGRDIYRQISEEVVDPLIQGDIGKIAGKGYDPQVTPPIQRILSVITDEKLARPLTIRNVYTRLNADNKDSFPHIVRLSLENAFDEASKDVQSGANRMLGANFKKSVYGTPRQRENFLEMMGGVAEANGVRRDDLQRGAVTLLDTLEKTGKIPGIGSPTGGRIETNAMARNSRVAGALDTVSTQPLGPLASKLRDIANRKAYRDLADAFTHPDSVQKLLELSKLTPSSMKAQLLAVEILTNRSTDKETGNTGNQEEQNNR